MSEEQARVNGVLAGVACRDLERSVSWFTALLGAPPSRRPMEGLAEWHLDGAGTLQLTVDEGRAGGSVVTLEVADIDGEQRRLADLGIDLSYDSTTSDKVTFAQLTDPDGNSVAIVEAAPGFRPQG